MRSRSLSMLVWLAAALLLAQCTSEAEGPRRAATAGTAPTAKKGSVDAPRSEPSGSQAKEATPTTYSPALGTETLLSIEWASTTSLMGLEGADDAPPAASGHVRAAGTLALTVSAKEDSATTLRAKLDLGKLEVSSLDADLPPEAITALRELLARPFEMSVTPRGQLQALLMDPEARNEPLVVGLVTSIVRIARPALPPDSEHAAAVAEEDLTGAYVANYSFRNAHLEKTRAAYTRLFGAPPEAEASAAQASPSGSATVTGQSLYTLDAEGNILTARMEETLVLTSGQPTAPGISTTSQTHAVFGRLEHVPSTQPAVLPESAAPTARLVPVLFEPLARAMFARGEESYVRPPTVESALLRLGSLVDAPPRDRDRLRGIVLRVLIHTLRARPESAAAIGTFVSSHGDQEIIDVVALSALRIVGDEACQSAMVSLLERARSLPTPAARQAIIQAGGLKEPGRAVTVALGSLAKKGGDDIARGAALALGRVAGHLPRERARGLVDDLVALTRGAANDDLRGTYLAALGNARTDRADVLALFDTAVGSSDPRLRARGVDAFRLVPGGRADVVLRARMKSDRDPNVRAAAVVASRARSLNEYLPVYDEVLATEKEPAVRRAIVEVLTGASPSAGDARALLERVAKSDPDAEIRELAQRALAPAETHQQ